MLIPKASHLAERVAERLLRSGALDDSAAQLLRPAGDQPNATAGGAISQPAAEPVQRSSLFAPPPAARPSPALPPGPTVAVADFGMPANGDEARPIGAPILPSPAILGQPRIPGQPGAQAAVMDRPADFAGSAFAGRGLSADPAAGLLQGPTSVDAVSLERAGMVDWSRTRTRISEEFRLVQRQIIRSAFGPGAEPGFSNLLLVTSARPGEGKSFMSTNLAGSIARQGDHHVLLVDADSKRDSICYSLGLAQARGLLDLAANPKLDPAPLIVKTPIERLSILPVGRERERSAELFSTKEMTRLIQSLGRRYADRLLILDAPPCLSTSDPAVLAQVVGQILFVVEADRTQRDEIEASLDLIQACPTITMVLNKQQISSRYTFGAYSSYYSS
jgi:protein-tyrosine kinase